MNNLTISPAGRRAAMNGNRQIRIALHCAYIARVFPASGGARVEYHGAPGFITDFTSVDEARKYVSAHNEAMMVAESQLSVDEYIDYNSHLHNECERFYSQAQAA